MIVFRPALLISAETLAKPLLHSQAAEVYVASQIRTLRSLPLAIRPKLIFELAQDILKLAPGFSKLKLADTLTQLATEGDAGNEVLQAVADTLANALMETPVRADEGYQIPRPYVDLASLVRYEGVVAAVNHPLFVEAMQMLANNDAEIEKVDFTLKDLNDKDVTLSHLRGKIVLVNFWATWCAPCCAEMPDLNLLFTHFQSQGLIILSITEDEAQKVAPFIQKTGYRPTVLLDADDRVHKLFHVEGIPKTFLLGRDGRLLSTAIDRRTRRQFLQMLSKSDLH